MRDFSFKKSERLTSQRIIGELFTSGKSFFLSPFRMYWVPAKPGQESRVQIAISVPKKRIRRAVDRNRIRRKIKEAYRKNKSLIQDSAAGKKGAYILLVYSFNEDMSCSLIEENLIKTIQRFLSLYEKSS